MGRSSPNRHRLAYLIASSVVKILEIERARIDAREASLPITLDRPRPGMRIELVLPSEIEVASDSERPYLAMDLDLECLVVTNGIEVHGYDWAHRWVPLPKKVSRIELVLGNGRVDTRGIALERELSAQLRSARVLIVDERVRKLSIALLYLTKLWNVISDPELRDRLARLINDVLKRVAPPALDPLRMAMAYEVLRQLDELQGIVASPAIDEVIARAKDAEEAGYRFSGGLGELCEEEYRRLLDSLSELARIFGKRGEVIPIAQSHLDYLWLWGRSSFLIKLGKTFATCLSIAREAPWITTVFTCSHYLEELKKFYPRLFEELRECVYKGSCTIVGGIWSEFDANTIDGEALARQFLYGQRTLKELFGKEASILYLPDTFGFPPTLPEVAKLGGIELFIDRKLSWNDTNRFPYMYFKWVSPSGKHVVAVYAGHCYTHELEPSKLVLAWSENSEKSIVNSVPLLFGYGDGGGGPTLDQIVELEVIDRCPILPRVRRASLDTLVNELRRVENSLPIWFGELYLENHRGVYSTGIELKNSLKNAVKILKVLDALRSSLKIAGLNIDVDKGDVDRAWKLVLQSYFHDTASATLSPSAYRDALKEIEEATEIASRQLSALINKVFSGSGRVVIFNPVPWRRRVLARIEGVDTSLCIDGRKVPSQRVKNALLVEIELPALGYVALEPCGEGSEQPVEPVSIEVFGDEVRVSVNGVEYVVGEGGVLSASLRGLKVIERGNEVKAYRDFPREWDAWNVDEDYVEEEISVDYGRPRVVEEGPLRACIESEVRFLSTRIEQRVCIERPLGVVRIVSRALVRDRHVLAKAWFRHSLVAHRAVIEAPLGVFERNLYPSTSWERAKFEAWMGRWVAISQNDVGFAIVSIRGSKGVSLGPNAIGYTLFRAPTYPHPLLDSGIVENEYVVHLFRGPWFEAGIHRLAIGLELEPLIIVGGIGDGVPLGRDLLKVEPRNIAVECVKPSEDGRGLVIHGFEACGCSSKVEIYTVSGRPKRVAECNWQETALREFSGAVKPYQVICLYVDVDEGL